MSGFITDGSEVSSGIGLVQIGDNIDDLQKKGYLSFSLPVPEGTVDGCTITILDIELIRHPEDIGDTLNIRYLEYGDLDESDFDLEGELIYSVPVIDLENITIPSEALLDTYQRAIDDPAIDYYQLEFSINGTTNADGRSDLITFNAAVDTSIGGGIQ